MAKKNLVTQEQAEQWAQAALDATDDLQFMVSQFRKMNVEMLKADGHEIAATLMNASRNCADAAVNVMAWMAISEQDRKLTSLREQLPEGKSDE